MTIFGGSPDDPVSGQTPADALGNVSPMEVPDPEHPNLAEDGLEDDPLG